MDDRSLKTLEYYQFLETLKEYAVSPLGRKRCEALRPLEDLPQIRSRSTEVLEIEAILENLGDFPIAGLKDIEGTLRRLEVEGATLSVQELLDVVGQMELCKGLKRFFNKLDSLRVPRLQEKISKLSSLRDLEKEILRTINTKGEILDRASSALSEIRRQIGSIRDKVKSALEHMLHREEDLE